MWEDLRLEEIMDKFTNIKTEEQAYTYGPTDEEDDDSRLVYKRGFENFVVNQPAD